MSAPSAARLWAGSFAVSVLAHAGLGWALSMVPTGGAPPATETRFEIRPATQGEAERVPARRLQAVADAGAALRAAEPAIAARTEAGATEAAVARPVLATRAAPTAAEAQPIEAATMARVEAGNHAEAVRDALSLHAGDPAPAARVAAEQTAAVAGPVEAAVPPESRRIRPAGEPLSAHRPDLTTDAPPRPVEPARIAAVAAQDVGDVHGEGATSAASHVAAGSIVPEREVAADIAATAETAMTVQSAAPRSPAPAPTLREGTAMAGSGQAAPQAPIRSSPATVSRPATGTTEVARLVPEAPRQPEPAVSIQDQLAGALRAENSGGCFVALAAETASPLKVRSFAADPARLSQFERRLAAAFGDAVEVRSHAIAGPQCATMAFLHQREQQPESTIGILIDQPVIASGTELSGMISGLDRLWLYLMVVDDEGVVHELPDVARDAAGAIRFRVPLTLTSGWVGTAQLLVAIGADEALETPAARAGGQADAFFAALEAELRKKAVGVDLGITGFRLE